MLSISKASVGRVASEETRVSVGLDDAFRVDTTQERIHPGHVERGRRPVIRGADTRVEMAATTPIRDKSQQPGDSLDFSPCLSMKLSTFLSRANAVPGQEVLAAGWQTGYLLFGQLGKDRNGKTARSRGAERKGGRRSDRVGRIGCQVPACCIPFLVWSHTVTQPTRHGREGRERRTQP